MAIGDIKTFDIVYQGLTLQIVAVDNADGTVDFTVTSLLGSADINALYWNDGDATGGEGILFGFTGAKSESSLNMNGSGEAWDGGVKSSSAGIGPLGAAKPTYLQEGESYTIENVAVSWNDIDTLGVRATSTSTEGGSIKGVDGDADNAPVASDDVWVLSNTAIPVGTITPLWFTNNDTDLDSDTLYVTEVAGLTADGPIGSTGLTADFEGGVLVGISGTAVTGDYSFTYTVFDGTDTDTGSVSLTVKATSGSANSITLTDNDFSYISGQGGADTITGPVVDGNAGIDIFNGNAGRDTLNGGQGNDTLNGGAGNDDLNGNAGNDTLNGGEDDDTLNGNLGDDTLNGNFGNDNLFGGDNNDTLNGNNGLDTLHGNVGNDTLNGGENIDTLNRGAGDDTLNGDEGNDTLNGGAGNDILAGGAGDNRFIFAVGDSGVGNGNRDIITDFRELSRLMLN